MTNRFDHENADKIFQKGDSKCVIEITTNQIRKENKLNKPDTNELIQLFFLRGAARYSIGDIKGALKDFSEAIKIDPLNEIAKSNLDNLNKKI